MPEELYAKPWNAIEGAASGRSVVPPTGLDCAPDDAAEPPTRQGKLDVLNCLVFGTPHQFWLDHADELQDRIARGYIDENNRTQPRLLWLGNGDWVCTDPATEAPVPMCKKHDVAYESLQKFGGTNPTNEPGGEALGDERDETWNARNKALADANSMPK